MDDEDESLEELMGELFTSVFTTHASASFTLPVGRYILVYFVRRGCHDGKALLSKVYNFVQRVSRKPATTMAGFFILGMVTISLQPD